MPKSTPSDWLQQHLRRDTLKEFGTKTFKKVFSLHFMLIVSCLVYLVVGALIFQRLEGRHLIETKAEHVHKIEEDRAAYRDTVWRIIQDNPQFIHHPDRNAVVRQIVQSAQPEFNTLVQTTFTAHRTVRHGFEENAPSWDFMNSLFFTTTMLTSIGFGFVCPTTRNGRLFAVVYCLIGIPLTLVTVANVAKFLSESVFLIHYQIWKVWLNIKNRRRPTAKTESQQIFNDNVDEQEVLDKVRLIRFPPIVAFMFAVFYGFFGAFIIQRNEDWSYLETLYFTFISILTVGFGDFRPSPENLFTVLLVVLGGITVSTSCLDVVGRMYLKEIHYLGRKLRSNNPFYLLREAKAKRRRQAMASLLAQLARGMIFAHRQYNELSPKRSKKAKKRRGSHVLTDDKYLFARQAPDPPRDCQVISTSAYSVRLAWAPAFSADADVTYNIRYRLKYNEDLVDKRTLELRGISTNSAEIMSLSSCSLYEFRITAVSRYGESKPMILVQYTEPQLSPQHIMVKKLNANTVELNWEPPYKRTNDVKKYMVYYTDNPAARLADWEKITVFGRRVAFPELKYDWFYMFCANACFNDGQRSPLSRALFVKTDKLEFQSCYVGHSQTVEIMESLRNQGSSETSPLLMKRDYVSFAW
ncbi:Ion transport 2 and Fibronectin domain containing protein [Aphelenchoides besseyi]|nr:Ion transport 2 and Fibronectin domain containing protein [Aphelenchoides besseyi]